MGTTLQNGVYLPNEGERNCYAGLKTNWEILDQKVADVTALQQAVAGALHREIVESLPTTDIDPNTIYMVLSGTSATENVYNEFMYVNNAWELIGTSATDLTNYYTKAEVDGKLLLKANASDLTSHTGDTTIHVTTADKNKWNNQTYVFRYSSTALVASSTNANSLLDNTDNLKVGDKVIDSSGVLFSITAIDTQNSTFTIGTALIDLATDGDVVHKSGDETVSGIKTFSSTMRLTAYPCIRMYLVDDEWNVQPVVTKQSEIRFTDKNSVTISYFGFQHRTDSSEPFRTCWRQQKMDGTSGYYSINFNNLGDFYPENNNTINLGGSSNKWKSVYATNYYYGSNNVEFSTKFVTTDTAQNITATKTFDGVDINLKSNNAEYSVTSGYKDIFFLDKNSTRLAYFRQGVYSSGLSYQTFNILGYDSNNQQVSQSITFSSGNLGLSTAFLRANTDNVISLGDSTHKWSDVQTYKVNALEPSSLSLPSDRSARIDISSYFTNTGTGNTNTYTVPANGYICMEVNDCISLYMYSQTTGNLSNYGNSVCRNTIGKLVGFLPVRKNDVFVSQWYTTATNVTLTSAYFIPCQGNV